MYLRLDGGVSCSIQETIHDTFIDSYESKFEEQNKPSKIYKKALL